MFGVKKKTMTISNSFSRRPTNRLVSAPLRVCLLRLVQECGTVSTRTATKQKPKWFMPQLSHSGYRITLKYCGSNSLKCPINVQKWINGNTQTWTTGGSDWMTVFVLMITTSCHSQIYGVSAACAPDVCSQHTLNWGGQLLVRTWHLNHEIHSTSWVMSELALGNLDCHLYSLSPSVPYMSPVVVIKALLWKKEAYFHLYFDNLIQS